MSVPELTDGTIVNAGHWNANVNLINALELNQGTRGTNGTVYSEIGNLKTADTNLSGRVTTLETRTTDASTGNSALGTRLTTVENRKVKSYKTTLAQPASVASNAIVNLGSISIPSPGFTYTLWFSMFTGPQWDSQFGYCNLNIQTSSTWGTGVLTQGAIYAQANGLKINGGIWFTTDGNQTRTGAVTLYAMLECKSGNINGMGVGSMSAMVIPS